jgi:DNA-binding NarL/FixJ family response regulator
VSVLRIALISDDRLLCDGVIRILQADGSFEVVSMDVGRGPVAGADVVLIDSRLDDAFERCAGVEPAAVLLIAAPDTAEWCHDALCAGASGVLPKRAGADELIQAVRVVHEGSVWAPRRVMAACIKHLVSGSVARRAGDATLERQLSRREREIFRHAASGLANKELASRFAIEEATVKAHLTRIFQKLGVRGRAELAAVYHGGQPIKREPRPTALYGLAPAAMVVRRKSNPEQNGAAKK